MVKLTLCIICNSFKRLHILVLFTLLQVTLCHKHSGWNRIRWKREQVSWMPLQQLAEVRLKRKAQTTPLTNKQGRCRIYSYWNKSKDASLVLCKHIRSMKEITLLWEFFEIWLFWTVNGAVPSFFLLMKPQKHNGNVKYCSDVKYCKVEKGL